MRDAINQVGDRYGLSRGWLNQDFRKTASFSEHIAQYSVPYRTFSNILHVRTLPAEYLAAMKLCSFREYKYDKSDVIGLIMESGISREQIDRAVKELYGDWRYLAHEEWAKRLLDEIYATEDLRALYAKVRADEQENFSILKAVDAESLENLTNDNIEEVLALARKARGRK